MATTSNTVELILRAKDETAAAFDSMNRHLETMRGHLESVKSIVIGGLGFEAVNKAVGGIEAFADGLIQSNINAQNLQATLLAVYGNVQKAQLAWNFIQSNEVKVPFAEIDIATAATNVARFGGNITQVIPTLETFASVFRSTLGPNPLRTAAQAWQDLHAGLSKMAKRDLGITPEELVGTGFVSFGPGKHLVGDLDSALAALAAKKYPNAIAASMNTLSGALSSLETQWVRFERVVGTNIFVDLQRNVSNFVSFLQAHQGEVRAFGSAIGEALSNATRAVTSFALMAAPWIGSAIILIVKGFDILQKGVSQAFNFVGTVVGGFVNWLKSNALPPLETILGTVAQWWQANATNISNTIQVLGDDVGMLVEFVRQQFSNAQTLWGGALQIAWGLVSTAFSTGMALITGNWGTFQADLNKGINKIMGGFVNLTAGAMSSVATLAADIVGYGAQLFVPLTNGLITAANAIGHGLNDLFTTKIQPFIALVAGVGNAAFSPLMDAFRLMANGIIKILQEAMDHIPGFILDHIPHGNDIKNAIDKMKGSALESPADAFRSGQAAANDLMNKHPLGLGKDQNLIPGVSVEQARRDIENARKGILAPILADIEAHRKSILAQYGLSETPGKGPTYQGSQQAGASILQGLLNMINGVAGGLGGKLTLEQFLKALGLKPLGGGSSALKLPGPNDLAMPPPGGATGPTELGSFGIHQVAGLRDFNGVVSKIAQDATASLAGQRAATGRVPLGALGATFMQTVATTAGMHTGTNPAVKAAERQADLQASSYSEEKSHTRLLASLLDSNRQIVAALAALGKPLVSPTPPNVPRQLGVFRPVVN